MVVKGIAYIHLDGKEFELEQGNSIDIKKKSVHFIQNRDDSDLEIIEIQNLIILAKMIALGSMILIKGKNVTS